MNKLDNYFELSLLISHLTFYHLFYTFYFIRLQSDNFAIELY